MIRHIKVEWGISALALVALAIAVTGPATNCRAAEMPRTTVAVMEFHVDGKAFESGQGRVMGELLSGELLDTGKYTVVERIQLDKAAQELSLQAGGQIDPATAAALGRRVGAQVVVVGVLAGSDTEKLVMGRFVDVSKGSVLVAKNLTVSSNALLKPARELVSALVDAEEQAARALQKKARRLADLGQVAAAQDLYEQLATRYSRTSVGPDAVIQRARFYLQEGDYFGAADQAEGFLETYPAQPLAEEALFVLAESKYFTVYGDPEREADPRAFLETWRKNAAGQGADHLDSIRLKARLSQEAKQKYNLLLAEFPATKHAGVVKERLAVINHHGGQ